MFAGLPFSYMFMVVVSFGTLFSLSSSHWLGVWAGLEINLIGFLPVLVYQKSMLESESAVKYFVVQALGSSFLMFGSLFAFSLSLSWEMMSMSSMTGLTSAFLLCAGLLLKMGVFPFHFWFPGVMAGLSWFSCLLLSTWQKLAPIFLVLGLTASGLSSLILFFISLIGAGSSLIGGLGGLNQTQIRGLLAYSSIGHMGWILFGLCSSESSMKLYFSIYVLISVCMFMSLWLLDTNNLKSLGSLSVKSWIGGFSFLLILLSLGGLPPLLGFISKWIIISSSVASPTWGLLFVLVLGSLMSLFYYLSLFFSEVLALKGESLSSEYLSTFSGGMYINLILLMNCLGGLVFLFMMPTSYF